jgi:LysM repeat protein/lysophospholipase L1-like esterase
LLLLIMKRSARPLLPALLLGLFLGLAPKLLSVATGEKHLTQAAIADTSYIASQLHYDTKYPFIAYRENYFAWQDYAAIAPLIRQLQQTPARKLNVVHIGDSHLQADIFTGHVRARLQDIFGAGGRGMIFPYDAAGTHDAYDYSSQAWGPWQAARNVERNPQLPLGLSGATIRTRSPNAGFRIRLSQRYGYPNPNRRLRIYCDCSPASYAMEVRVNDQQTPIRLHCSDSGKGYVATTLPDSVAELQINAARTTPRQRQLTIYGLQLQNRADKGVLYNSVGINGAGFQDLPQQELLAPQLASLQPDLVVLDLGGNDYFHGELQPDTFASHIRRAIQRVQAAAPQAAVLVSCSQDINRHRYYCVEACRPASEIARRVAYETGAAFYNYYEVAGGIHSMTQWYARGLAKSDRVHLTLKGYQNKAQLFTNALLNSYYRALAGHKTPYNDSTPLPSARFRERVPAKAQLADQRLSHRKKRYYKVQAGDALSLIAERFGVSIRALQRWNHLPSTRIRAGQRLVIYLPADPSDQPPVKTVSADAKQPASYTVQRGDSLWAIAERFGVTIRELCRRNAISRSTPLTPGMELQLR